MNVKSALLSLCCLAVASCGAPAFADDCVIRDAPAQTSTNPNVQCNYFYVMKVMWMDVCVERVGWLYFSATTETGEIFTVLQDHDFVGSQCGGLYLGCVGEQDFEWRKFKWQFPPVPGTNTCGGIISTGTAIWVKGDPVLARVPVTIPVQTMPNPAEWLVNPECGDVFWQCDTPSWTPCDPPPSEEG